MPLPKLPSLPVVIGAGALVAAAAAMAWVGSDRWVAAGFAPADQRTDSWRPGGLQPVVADETYWLRQVHPLGVVPAVAPSGQKLVLGPMEVLSVTPVSAPATSGDGDRPMVLVTAREATPNGTRIVRVLIEAEMAPAGKGL